MSEIAIQPQMNLSPDIALRARSVDKKSVNEPAQFVKALTVASKDEPAQAEADNVGSKITPQLVIAPQNENNSEQVSREDAMQIFLQRMQDELGVEPEEILQSFAQLDVADLTAPPEKTIEKVIGQLNLSPEKEKQAEDMYAEMLALSATAGMSEYLKNQNQTANLAVLSPKQAAQKEIQKNIATMSDTFFVKGNVQQPQAVDGIKKMQGTQAYGKASAEDRKATIAASSGGTATLLATQAPTLEAAPVVTAKAGAGAIALPNDVEELSLDQQKDILASLKKELADLDMKAPQASVADSDAATDMLNTKVETSSAVSAPSTQAATIAPFAIAAKNSSSQAESDKDNDKKDNSNRQDSTQAVDSKNQTTEKLNVKNQFVVETPKAAKSDAQNNIQDVISQAQFLAKKGGGEMKVKMSPEGMGDVHLKVIVDKGQVNVEMVASNTEAKKLLERGIDELKANLVSHKLHVDQIKVGGASETSNQLGQQQDDGQRQYQQKFLQDFQNQNSAFRREIFDIGTARRPGSQVFDEASNTKFNPSKKKSSGSRRLDLVA